MEKHKKKANNSWDKWTEDQQSKIQNSKNKFISSGLQKNNYDDVLIGKKWWKTKISDNFDWRRERDQQG